MIARAIQSRYVVVAAYVYDIFLPACRPRSAGSTSNQSVSDDLAIDLSDRGRQFGVTVRIHTLYYSNIIIL